MNTTKKRIFGIVSDLAFSIAGLLLMNGMLQLLINPMLNNWLGETEFGNYQSIFAVVSIMGTTFGVAANYSRMVRSREHADTNGDYNIFLTAVAVLSVAVAAVTLIGYKSFSVTHFILLSILTILTVLRYYGDVNYRMSMNYKGFFLYYVLITVGYCVGLLAFKYISSQWMLTIIVGELAAVIFVAINGSIFKGKNLLKPSENFKGNIKSVSILSGTNIISAVAQNADKIILRLAQGGEAVTTFYVSTLLGKVISLLTTPLNSVLISYLTKYEGKITKKIFSVFALALLGVGAVAWIGCFVASIIFVKIFYPDVYDTARQYFLLANLGQIFYFISNSLMTVLLRMATEKYQMMINIVYAVIYAAAVIPLTLSFGLWGITIGLLIANGSKFLIVSAVGFFKADKPEKKAIESGQ
ncbi:MAG: hypothetical protein LUG85_03090 [Clostridiales bacterium]|nr:hypothetical protein [Clostridiales bacterium]